MSNAPQKPVRAEPICIDLDPRSKPLLSLPCHVFVLLCPVKLIAEDADSQPNGQIRFSIVNGDRDNEFAVDPVLGLVKVKKKLDRERVS